MPPQDIHNEIYTGEGKKLEKPTFSVGAHVDL
jgi:hypothetical protein